METEIWWTLQLEPNQLVTSGYIRTNTNNMVHLIVKKKGLRRKDMRKNKEFTMKKHSPPQQNGIPSTLCSPWQHKMGGKSTKWM